MVKEDNVHRYLGHFLVGVHSFLGGSVCFIFVPTSPGSHYTLVPLTRTHPEPCNLPTLILTFSTCQLEVECWSIVTSATKMNAMYGAWSVSFNLGTLLANSWGKNKENVGVDDVYLCICSDSLKGAECIFTSWQAQLRYSISPNLLTGSVSCITWPFHLLKWCCLM